MLPIRDICAKAFCICPLFFTTKNRYNFRHILLSSFALITRWRHRRLLKTLHNFAQLRTTKHNGRFYSFINKIKLNTYSSTCHERTRSGPGKSVRTLQVAARHRDGWAGGGTPNIIHLAILPTTIPPVIFLMNTRIVIIMYAIVVNLKLMQHNN